MNYFVEDQLIHIRKVEVQVAFNCNLTCKGCVHGSPAQTAKFLDPEAFRRDLLALKSVARLHQLMLLGGEPLLHPKLIDLLELARASGVATHLGLITNGLGLERMPDALFSLLDMIEVSHYPGVHLRYEPEQMAARAASLGCRFLISDCKQFQITHLNAPIPDPALVGEIYRRCKPRNEWSCHTLADGRYYMCSRSPLLCDRLAALGQQLDNRAQDGIALHDNPDLFADLVQYLKRETPLQACQWCLGSDGATFAHALLNKKAALQEATQVVHFTPAQLSPQARQQMAHILPSAQEQG